MENMERRQDDRHRENSESLRRIHEKIEPITASIRTICGDETHPGRMGTVERDVAAIKELLGKLDKKMAVWGGVMAAFLILVEVVSRLIGGWPK